MVPLHAFETLMGQSVEGPTRQISPGFLFTMSVGYDLDGIRNERMDHFILRLIDSSSEPLFQRYGEELDSFAAQPDLLDGTPWRDNAPLLRGLARRVSPRLSSSVTLSTMHGCPPQEIESICAYMLNEKKLDTLVKLNPTLLGYERAKDLLRETGFVAVELKPDGFQKDLQYPHAVSLLGRLLTMARVTGRHFGAKLSNTLAAANTRNVLPGDEMYMSGRALYPLTMRLAADLSAELGGALPLSFSGGASAWNLADILSAGLRPVTLATDLLKPGGYARFKQLADIAVRFTSASRLPGVDAKLAERAADKAKTNSPFQKDFRGDRKITVPGALPLYDCFVAPCVLACPIHQDVPEYVHLAGAGKWREAFEVIHARNPLPFMTGYLCDHQCTENCTRRDWEGAVRIREVKRIVAEKGFSAFKPSVESSAARAATRGMNVAIIGAGPAGLAAASFLRREGFDVHVFERESEAGGVVRWLLPPFRIPVGAVEKDIDLLRKAGVQLHFGAGAESVSGLRNKGFTYVLVAIGAEADKDARVPEARAALTFLREFRRDPSRARLGRAVAVVGAGDTAMDAARAALKCRGVKEVRIVYRRGQTEMPASRDEYESARAEGVRFHFLRAPLAWKPGEGLTCQIMTTGPIDASGRRAALATEATEVIPADSVITAVGTESDARALAAAGIQDARDWDPVTGETGQHGVFLIGDAGRGPATIVEAIGSARAAVDAICAREAGSRVAPAVLPPEDVKKLRAERDHLVAVSSARAADRAVASMEAQRCLGCRALCMKCVEVCPNRANTVVNVARGFRDEMQIIHIDAFCNECGNCSTFCPWDGRPYRDKLTIFVSEEDYRASENPGFYLDGGVGMLRVNGHEGTLRASAESGVECGIADESTRAVVRTIMTEHAYLLGGAQ